jgi:PhzF family phenazine biosynthesis protein
MATVPCLQVDAFADRPFTGNPAAVCLLEREAAADWMQAVASEMNLSETAFVHPRNDGFGLRWFTPSTEVDLCGHATLAAAHALWSEGVVPDDMAISFHTKSGELGCESRGNIIELDFPATPVESEGAPDGLLEALGVEAEFTGHSRFDALVVVDSAQRVRALEPDFAELARVPVRGVIVTGPSDDARFDFVSRFFGPAVGIDEDPVTGSAHCCLAPYWSERLGKSGMMAFQASQRGGVLSLRLDGDRVHLGGTAVTVLKGELTESASPKT